MSFFTRTQPITLMPRFSLPIMTTSRDDCAMQIAGIFLVFCSGTMAPWSGLIPRVLCWGFFRSWNCLMEERQLFPGDTLALYTDGVTEAFNDQDEEFGEQRLIEALRQHSDLPLPALLKALIEEVRQFSSHEQHDDITVIVAK